VGYNALSNTTSSIIAGNTAIGYNAGSNVITGSGVICIGHNSQASSSSVIGEITIDSGVNNSVFRVNALSTTYLSDVRDKTDIMDLPLGLSLIKRVRPVIFKWDRRDWYTEGISDGSKKEEKISYGFIAQELDQVQQDMGADWLNLVYKSNPDKLEVTAGQLLVPLIKAVQELSERLEFLENKQ
jgi:hypothetical protein